MTAKQPALRTIAALAAAGALALTGVACGGDEDPQEVAIEATGSKNDLSFEVPSEAEAGAAEITFTNSTEGDVDSQMLFIEEERSDEEIVAELQKAVEGEAVADWFQAAGGAGTTKAGESSTVTQELEEGTYYVVGSPGDEAPPKTPLPKIVVSGDGGADLPDADATVTAEDYSFTAENLKAGKNEVLFENAGKQWHHLLGGQLKPGATIEEAKAFLETEKGEPPFAGKEGEGPETTVLDGGVSQIVELDLKPGKYAFFCFIADKQGGPPHVAKGMVSEVTVEE